jgi:hypothetical protein
MLLLLSPNDADIQSAYQNLKVKMRLHVTLILTTAFM